MTNAEQFQEAEKKEIEQATQDLQDISALKNHPAWNRYFRRHLTQSKETMIKNAIFGKGLSLAEREELRQKILYLDELEGMLTRHEAVCRSVLLRVSKPGSVRLNPA